MSAFRRYGQESFATIRNHSTAMRKWSERRVRWRSLRTPAAITGETGTGKELLARACHYASNRSLKPFIAVLCVLPDDVTESELFGYAGYEENAAPKRVC